jgi:hypothetical protein
MKNDARREKGEGEGKRKDNAFAKIENQIDEGIRRWRAFS